MDEKCFSYGYNEAEFFLNEEIRKQKITDIIDSYTLSECICCDYPNGAKKIVDIFFKHIVPKIKEYDEKNQETTKSDDTE